jgi:arabinofuranan 3-O-arabinosyltransferase
VNAPAVPGGLARYLRRASEAHSGPLPGYPGTDDEPDARWDGPTEAAPSPWAASSRRWFLVVWLIALIVLAANDRGRMIFDTKLGVDIDAARFYARLWPLWNPLEWFGTLQDQYIGYAIPMGPFFLIGQTLHLPIWFIERLWLSLIIAAGFWGMTRLATALRIGSESSRLLAGVVFVLWPTFTIVIGSTSAAALPGLMAPWAILPLISGLRGQRSLIVSCARSGVAVLLMGGVNAVSTLAVLLLPGLYILTHAHGRRRVATFGYWGVAVAAASAWWAIPLLLQGHYSFNFLPFVEQSATTTQTMSAAAFLRGAGNWTAYFDLGGPFLSAGWAMVANPGTIVASAAAAAVGLYGLARRDMPERLWACLCVGVAALAMIGYPGPLGGPLHGLVGTLLNGAFAPFRNVSKFEPVVAAVLALGIAHAFGRGSLPFQRAGRNGRIVLTVALAPVIALSLTGLAWPYLSDQILQPGSFTQVPSYWSKAAAYLVAHSPDQTALVVPGDSHGIYMWGDSIDEPLEPLASSPWAERSLVPYGGPGSQVFLDTAETAIESGQDVPGLVAYLERAGIRYVVVRNDLSTTQIGYTSPEIVHQTLSLSGFRRVASFGPLITGIDTNPFAFHQVQAYLPKYPAVEVFEPTSAAQRTTSPVATLPVSQTAYVNGGPDSLLQLDGQGILGSSQPAVIAGDSLAGRPAVWAVTDGQRRTDNAFGLINNNVSFTYTPTETNPIDDGLGGGGAPPRQIIPVPAAGHETVSVLHGAASITASSYGSWLTYEPQYDPANAFDGNSNTAWTEGSPNTPVGQWIQITFNHTLDLPSSIGIQLLLDNIDRSVANELQVSTARGKATTTVLPTNDTQQLLVRPGKTTWLRITILGASNDVPGNPGAGIREVVIPGVKVTRYLQPAQSSAGAAASSVAFSFHQSAPAPAGSGNSAATITMARTFSLSQAMPLQLTGSAVAQPSGALNSLLARLEPLGKSTLQVSASSTWGSLQYFGPDNLFDNSPTPWISGSSNPSITLSWLGDRTISQLVVQPGFGFVASPPEIQITSADGTRTAPVRIGGEVTVSPPLTTNQITISFPGWAAAKQPGSGSGTPALGLSELSIPALAGLHVGGPAASTTFSLPCGQGPSITLDGQAIQTAVSGTLGDLDRGLPVQMRSCTPGGAVTLGSGRHDLVATPGLFTTTDVMLQTAQSGSVATSPTRTVRVQSWQPDSRAVRIGPGQETYLEVHQNANPGWVASLNGRPLSSAVLDGWQQAFIVPAGAGGVITMTFAPAGVYHAGLILSALLIIGLIAVATVQWRTRGRRARSRHRSLSPPARLGYRAATELSWNAGRLTWARGQSFLSRQAGAARWAGLIAVAILIAGVGGPVVVAVPVLAFVAAFRPRLLPLISLAAMLLSGIIAALSSSPAGIGSGAFGPNAQACALVALAAALYPHRSRQEDPTGVPAMDTAEPSQARLALDSGPGLFEEDFYSLPGRYEQPEANGYVLPPAENHNLPARYEPPPAQEYNPPARYESRPTGRHSVPARYEPEPAPAEEYDLPARYQPRPAERYDDPARYEPPTADEYDPPPRYQPRRTRRYDNRARYEQPTDRRRNIPDRYEPPPAGEYNPPARYESRPTGRHSIPARDEPAPAEEYDLPARYEAPYEAPADDADDLGRGRRRSPSGRVLPPDSGGGW